jgi:hypothetical protein
MSPAPHPSRPSRPSAMNPDLDYQRQRKLESSAFIPAPPAWREPLGRVRRLLGEAVTRKDARVGDAGICPECGNPEESAEYVTEALGVVRGLLESDRYRPGFSVHDSETDIARMYVEALGAMLTSIRLLEGGRDDVALGNLRREWETRVAQLETT